MAAVAAAAPDQPREIVPAELVGAQKMVGIRSVHPERNQQALAEILREGIVRHEEGCKNGAECREADDDGAEPGAGAAPAAPWTSQGFRCRYRNAHALRSRGSSTAFIRSANMVSAT